MEITDEKTRMNDVRMLFFLPCRGRTFLPLWCLRWMRRVLVLSVVFGTCYLLRWERCPYYDKTSPDGRFRVEVYGNFFYCFIPCAPGQGGDRPAMVKLIEVETGRMLAKAYVDRLALVHDTFWYTNSVEITRGDYGHTFELPPPQ